MTAVITRPRTRRADELDRDAILAMYERCSPATRFARWHGQTAGFPSRYLNEALAGSDAHLALVFEADGEVIGLGSAVLIGATTREVGLLIEDRWQRRGVGRQLVEDLAEQSMRTGTRHWRIELLLADVGALELFRPLGALRRQSSFGTVIATLDLGAGDVRLPQSA